MSGGTAGSGGAWRSRSGSVAELLHWWVTIRLDACRTRDEVIQARSQYAAGWLYRQLHPTVEVISVRPVSR